MVTRDDVTQSERHRVGSADESSFGVVLLAVTGLGQYFGPQEGQHGHIKAAVAAHHDGTGEELWRASVMLKTAKRAVACRACHLFEV